MSPSAGKRPPRPKEPAASGPGPVPDEPSALEELAREETTARTALTREKQDALDRQARFAGWFMLFGIGPAQLEALRTELEIDGLVDGAILEYKNKSARVPRIDVFARLRDARSGPGGTGYLSDLRHGPGADGRSLPG